MKKIIYVLILTIFKFSSMFGQTVETISNVSGLELTSSQKNELTSISTKIDSLFNQEVNFKIIDGSYYLLNESMTEEQKNRSWQKLKYEAQNISDNYLLLVREYRSDKTEFKLWIDLKINSRNLLCYEEEINELISANLLNAVTDLEEWNQYLSREEVGGNFEIQLKVASLAFQKLSKICCEDLVDGESRRISSCSEELDDDQKAYEKDLKYFVIGSIKSVRTLNCPGDYLVDLSSYLGRLNSEDFLEDEFSVFTPGDRLAYLGLVHVYLNGDFYLDKIYCEPIPTNSTRYTYDGIQINVIEYNFGRFTIVCEDKENFNLTAKLDDFQINVDANLIKLIEKEENPELPNLTFHEYDYLRYLSERDLEKISNKNKSAIINIIVSDRMSQWSWLSFIDKYPFQINLIYDNIKEYGDKPDKDEFFKRQLNNPKFILDFLNYPYPELYRKTILNNYCKDYRDWLNITEEGVLLGEKLTVEFSYIPYEINKFFSFYDTNMDVSLNNHLVHVKEETKWVYNSGMGVGTQSVLKPVDTLELVSPVFLPAINLQTYGLEHRVVPAAVLLNMEEYINDENTLQTLFVSTDIISILSGVGVLGNLNKLGKIRVVFGTVEILAATASTIISNTDLIPPSHNELKKKILLYLTLIEVGVSGVDYAAMKRIRKKGNETLQEIIDTGDEVIPSSIKTFIARSLGKDGLLERIPDGSTLKNYVTDLTDISKINKLNELSDAAIVTLSNLGLAPSKYNKFVTDILKYDNLISIFNSNYNTVKAWDIARRAGLDDAIRTNPVDLAKISDYQTTVGKSADDIVAEIESSAVTASGNTRSWLDNVPSGGGAKIGQHGDYAIHESAEIFYRGISEADYQHLLNTGELKFTSETFTSPSLEYIQAIGYGGNGRIVKFYTNSGTLNSLEAIGVRNDGTATMLGYFPDMPHVSTTSNWTQNHAMFKTEGSSLAPPIGPTGQVNIGLGKGPAIDLFNQNLKAFEVVE